MMLESRLNNTLMKLLLIIASLLVLPHIGTLNPLFIVISLALIAWCGFVHFFNRFSPSAWLLLPLSLLLAFLVLKLHGMSLGREASSSFLLVLLGLKLLECRRQRDVLAVIFVSFFVLITPFLFEQTIALALYGLCLFFLLLCALIINASGSASIRPVDVTRFATQIGLLAFPLMLIGFLLFPRMIGPLWAMPKDASNAVSGISDSINPGQISHLALSNETAFRARFNGASPAFNELYWRGPVFWQTDGQQWTVSLNSTRREAANDPSPVNTLYRYSLVLEAHHQRWLYSLDTPITAPNQVRLTQDNQLLLKDKLRRTRSFDLLSNTQTAPEILNDKDRLRALALPKNTDQRVYQLAARWQADADSDIAVINTGLAYFNQEDFYYTLTPPRLGVDPVADFLFSTKRGFCGHYATSFAVVLRAANIPTRLVAGYQGGVYNAVGQFWEVRQADAHVWVEAWLAGRGWVRFDPTAAIAPNRIEHSIDFSNQRLGGEVRFLIEPSDGFSNWAQQLTSLMQAVDYYWESGVLAYGPEVQHDFLSSFGIDGWEQMVLWLALLSGGLILIVTLFLYRLSVRKEDPSQAAYLAFCKKLGRRFTYKKPAETSLHYFARIAAIKPDLEPDLQQIRQQYLLSRYAKNDARKLLALIRAFRF